MNHMEQLSKNFVRSEFACKGGSECCGGSAPISYLLIDGLQELRDRVNRPIVVVSGFRCLTYNRKIGSNDTSQHPKGRAADIRAPDMTVEDLREFALDVGIFRAGGVGIYANRRRGLKSFLHVDVRPCVARWEG